MSVLVETAITCLHRLHAHASHDIFPHVVTPHPHVSTDRTTMRLKLSIRTHASPTKLLCTWTVDTRAS